MTIPSYNSPFDTEPIIDAHGEVTSVNINIQKGENGLVYNTNWNVSVYKNQEAYDAGKQALGGTGGNFQSTSYPSLDYVASQAEKAISKQ